MYKYIVEGGHPVKGRVAASGNKNAALPCLAAAVLAREPVVLKNIPEIEDVAVMIEVLVHLGAQVKKLGSHEWSIDPRSIERQDVPAEQSRKVRASLLFAGPLLARFGQAILPPPGGDTIGRRRIDTHLLALQELGARITMEGVLRFFAPKLKGAPIFLDEASVTGTENAIMAAVLAEGRTVLRNSASEPHVQDLCLMLNAMGAKISGVGSNVLYIEGVPELGGCEYAIGPDFMEIGSFIGLAAVTRGEITIEGVKAEDLPPLRVGFNRLGISWELKGGNLYVSSNQLMKVSADLGGQIPKIDDAPWPGFPPDLTSIMTVVATQTEGTVLIHEKMFESRMFFVDKLIGMGARIVLCDPHRAVVSGPARLSGALLVSPDVRAGMAMVIAALCADGQSTIQNVYQIERGYERISERLKALGAYIERIENC
ncbi:MAG: UDP-N-acetylglucosamine 1-carboxyvinyltransferase [Spirochaetia bacterium]|nr:UDP-N-acetylglucosamine 1-carboxyvinyltransferase [Spirochaetia bacterium]MCE1209374.1 UDP-N-acetylglucosamine 1-carboxyvinyltransferase [Spirochaetia bacterium]